MDNLPWIILILVIFCFIILPKAILKFIWRRNKCIEIASKQFVCPNCSCKFYTDWWHLYIGINRTMAELQGVAVLKCPKCNARDKCTRPYDEV